MSARRLTAVAAAAAVLGLAAGCGGGPSGAGTTTPPTVAQVAAQIGATGLVPYNPPTLYASQGATGSWHGRTVDIAVFASNTLRDNWENVAKNFAPILTDGPDYAVAGD